MLKKERYLITTGLLLVALLAGCAASKAPEPAKPAAPQPATEKPAAAAQTLTREQQLIEGAKKEGEVQLWAHLFPNATNVLKGFTDKYPFIKVKVWDSRGGEILAKMGEEAKAGRTTADTLILSSEIVDAAAMGMVTEYEFPNTKTWTNQPDSKLYRSYGGTVRITIYNSNLVQPADVPKTWDDVKSTKWAGRTFTSSSGEDTPLFWAHLWGDGKTLNWDKSFAFWTDFQKNTRPILAGGFSGPVGRLAAGEVALFPSVPSVAVFPLMAQGAPIGIAPLGTVSGDTVAIALVKNAPHPNAARLLLDWLTSEEGVLAYTKQTYYLALDPKLEDKSAGNLRFKALGISWNALPKELITQDNLKKSSDFWMKLIGVRG